MANRGWPGLGPVFAWEWRASSRRWQGYGLRSLLVLFLLLALSGVWLSNHEGARALTVRQWADIGRGFYGVTTLILLGLVGLAAPAATAGAICVDKGRGNLTLIFATDLSNSELVLGKLVARLIPVLGLIGCAAPVQAWATVFGGVDPPMVMGAILVCLACGIFGCSLALTLSVWGRKPHEVLLATYAFGIGWILATPIWGIVASYLPGWILMDWLPGPLALLPINPVFLAMAPLGSPPALGPIGLAAQARFFGLGLGASALLIAVATWRIRAVVIRQAGRGEVARRVVGSRRGPLSRLARCLPSPSLDRNPVLWREWHRRRPSRWSVAVWGLYAAFSVLFSLWAIDEALRDRSPLGRELASTINGVQASVGLLLLSVSAATSLSEERRQGSLDVLLATPLPTRSIVLGKWLGAFRGVPPLVVLPVLVAWSLAARNGYWIGPALIGGLILAYGAAMTSLGLSLATWVPRMGRVIGLTSGLYVTVLIGAVAGGILLMRSAHQGAGEGLAAASPVWGVGYSSSAFGSSDSTARIEAQAAWLVCWTLAYGLLAFGLLLATLLTFNRHLGRLDNTSTGPELAARPSGPSQVWMPDARTA